MVMFDNLLDHLDNDQEFLSVESIEILDGDSDDAVEDAEESEDDADASDE